MKKIFTFLSFIGIAICFSGCYTVYDPMTGTIKCGMFDFECKKEQENKKKQKEEQEKLRKEEKAKQEALRKEREQKLCKKGQPKVDCIYETKMLDGEIRSEVYYNKDGKKDGDEKEWDVWTSKDGDHQIYYVATKNTYKNGKLQYSESFYPNGNLKTQEQFSNNQITLGVSYNEDGSIKSYIEFGEDNQWVVRKVWKYKTQEPTFIFYKKTKVAILTFPPNPHIESPKIEYKYKQGFLDLESGKCLNGNKKVFKTQQDLLVIKSVINKAMDKASLHSDDYYICE